MSFKYSVIIPVYNAEKTLHRCVDSLLGENYPDCEIILINDGSKDGSGEICRAYAESHPNVKYIEKENGGVSSARNAGLDAATGEYVLFVDSDDYISEGYFALIDKARQTSDADLWLFSHGTDDGKTIKVHMIKPACYSDRAEAVPAIIDSICNKSLNAPWAKLYRREILENNRIRFPLGASVAEDRVFNIRYSCYVQNYAVSDRVLYYVSTENEDSLSRRRHEDLEDQFAVTRRYFEETMRSAPIPDREKEQYRRAVNFGDCRYIYHEAKLMLADQVGWMERQRRLGKLCDKINKKRMKYPKTSYCTLITMPVRLRLTWAIDAIAWKLTR